ncbi:MmgE/PrpD family protein [Agrobacterium vitis]
MTAINELARLTSSAENSALTTATREAISRLVLDLVGATAAGLQSPLAISTRRAALDAFGRGNVSVWLTDETTSVVGAALANSAAASALDIDDGHRGAGGHPGAGIIPAALAVAQDTGASDNEILMAIALGYEVGLRVATCRPVATIEKYATGRWINFGVAAATARLLRLNEEQTAHAIALAACEGPVMYLTPSSEFDGSSLKEGIPPATVAGVVAAYKARAGATGPIDVLDDEERFTQSILLSGLGSTWEVEKCYLKPYACCRYMHSAIDAIFALRKPEKPIQKLRIETFEHALRLANERVPTTLEGGQYSFYFSCALAALYGASALQPVEAHQLINADVLDLASRIELVASPKFAMSFPTTAPARVIIDQGDGPEELTIVHALGDVANPLSVSQIGDKLRNISRDSLASSLQERLISAASVVHQEGFTPLFAALSLSRDQAEPAMKSALATS